MAHNVGPIQVPLAGLYGLLGVKDGSNPDVMLGYVSPTIDAEGYWLRGTRERVSNPVGAALVAASQQVLFGLTVPQNQWWYLHSADLVLSTAAGGFAAITVADGQSAGNIHTKMQQALAFPGGNAFAYLTLGGVWLPPGSILAAQFGGTIGDQYSLSAVYVSKARI